MKIPYEYAKCPEKLRFLRALKIKETLQTELNL
jgi:hypothetical protein